MGGRVRISDVARRAGVSVATVDRVLSKRRPVKPATADIVYKAARELDFYASPLLKRRTRELVPERRLGFILQKQSKQFYTGLAGEIEKAARSRTDVHAICEFEFVDELSPRAISSAMRLMAANVQAMAVVALDHPHVWDEVARIGSLGIPAWALLSGLSCPEIEGVIGIDGRKAGRTAAWCMARCAAPAGRVGVLIGSHRYTSHEDREGGFRSYMREHSSPHEIVQSMAYLDSSEGAYEAVCELVSSTANLVGIYMIGGGVAGLVQALRDCSADPAVAVICHERDESCREALIEGTIDMVIETPLGAIAGAAVDAMVEERNTDTRTGLPPIPFLIHVSENI